jgi:glutaredoxin 3
VLDMNDPAVAARAEELGIKSVPAVAVNGELAGRTGRCIDLAELKKAGVGTCL